MKRLRFLSRIMTATLLATGVLLPTPLPPSGGEGKGEGGTVSARRAMITTLEATGPHTSLGAEASVWDQFVGTWDCQYTFHTDDGKVTHASGELLFGWILDGRAVQDIWITYPEKPGEEREIGTSLRFFDPKSRTWRVVFILPSLNILTTVEGRAQGDRIVLEGQTSDGKRRRWSFNDITQVSFVWRGERSSDGGKTWRLVEEHHMKRRSAGQP